MNKKSDVKGSKELFAEVVARGLCSFCGACAGNCPYIITHKGKPFLMFKCPREEGQCYDYCPRTSTDIEAMYQKIFGIPYDEEKVGVGPIKEAFLARSADKKILGKAQDGGVVTTLLSMALKEGIVDGALITAKSGQSPRGAIVHTVAEVLKNAGSSYEMAPVLEMLSKIPQDSQEKLAIVGVPCQVTAVGKMKTVPPRNRFKVNNVKLVIGLFCGFSYAPESFHEYLQQKFDMSQIVKYDIPHHPAHSFDVYTDKGKTEIDLDEIKDFVNPGCSSCCDMTSQFGDISVGGGRAANKGWNTVIVRTEAGKQLLDMAKQNGLLETKPLPPANLVNLRKASVYKIAKALKYMASLDGPQQEFGYLKIEPAFKEKFGKIVKDASR